MEKEQLFMVFICLDIDWTVLGQEHSARDAVIVIALLLLLIPWHDIGSTLLKTQQLEAIQYSLLLTDTDMGTSIAGWKLAS